MQATSKRLGSFSYQEKDVLTFQNGLCGFPQCTRFVLSTPASTAPVSWLISIENSDLTVPVVRPDKLFPEHAITALPVADVTKMLGCRIKSHARIYCVLTLPQDVTRASVNLRAPLLINPQTKCGVQYANPGIMKLPVRQPCYRELFGDPTPAQGMLVVLRKQNERITIGEDIVVEVLEVLPGGAVRLGVRAPEQLKVARGDGNLSIETENQRAVSSSVPAKELIALLRSS